MSIIHLIHFDDMIVKGYKLTNIYNFLMNGFKKHFEIKMKFRISFKYLYEKRKYIS